MRTVYHAESIIDAQFARDALEGDGIPAFVLGGYLAGGIGDLPARDYVSVAVPDSCEEAAAPVIERLNKRLAEARNAMDPVDNDCPGLLSPHPGLR